jgi:hypothetical protein
MSEPQSDALTTSPRPPQNNMAGAVGIEPTLEVLETSVLPLNYAPFIMYNTIKSYYIEEVAAEGIEPPTLRV